MPAKKKRGKRGKKKKKGKEGDSTLENSVEQKLDRERTTANAQISAIQKSLLLKQLKIEKFGVQKGRLERQFGVLERRFDGEKKKRKLISQEMVRKYNQMVVSLEEKIAREDSKVKNLEGLIVVANKKMEDENLKFERLLKEKDNSINEQKWKIEKMLVDFQDFAKYVLTQANSTVDNDDSKQQIDEKMNDLKPKFGKLLSDFVQL